jgi:hypothetical protein
MGEAQSSGSLFLISRDMHTTRAPQLTIVELIDALEAKIAAMRARQGRPADPDGAASAKIGAEMAVHWKTLWAPRANGRQRPKRTHPFSNIEEL